MAVTQDATAERVQSGKAQKRKRKHAEVVQPAAKWAAGGDDDDFSDLIVDDGTATEVEVDTSTVSPAEAGTASAPRAKKPRKKKPKPQAAFKANQAAAAEIATSSAEVQADWLWQSYSGTAGGSFLEQEAFTGESVLRLSGEGSLEEQLKAVVPEWQQALCNHNQQALAQPHCLIVSGAALGAIDLIRKLPNFNKACRIAKLFAKHMKVPEQQQYLQQHPVCIAAGTPNRLCKLADLEALQLNRLKLIILDVHQDAKQRTILDQAETKQDFWQLFSRHCQQQVTSGQVRFCLVNAISNNKAHGVVSCS